MGRSTAQSGRAPKAGKKAAGRKALGVVRHFVWADGRPATRRFADDQTADAALACMAAEGLIRTKEPLPQFDPACRAYLAQCKKFEKTPLYAHLKLIDCERFIYPVFKGKPMGAVNTPSLSKLRESVIEGAGMRAWLRVATILGGVVEQFNSGRQPSLHIDPFASLPYFRKDLTCLVASQQRQEKRLALPTWRQLRKMLDLSEGHVRLACKILILAGLRAGELLALQWKHILIDEIDKIVEISVEQAVKRDLKTIGDPKTKAGKRKVQADGELYEYLKSVHPGEAAAEDYLFMQENGELLRRWKLWSHLRLFQVSIGIGHRIGPFFKGCFSPHALRHACVAIWIWDGVPDEVMKVWIGHKRLTTTLDIYGYLIDFKDAGSSEWPTGEPPPDTLEDNFDFDDEEDDETEEDPYFYEAA